MQSELSFLLELLLNHPLKTPTKLAIKARIEAVEQEMATKPVPVYPGVSIKPYQPLDAQVHTVDSKGQVQSPSMAKAIAEMEAGKPVEPPVQPVTVTVAAAQALSQREQLINQALSGKSPAKIGGQKGSGLGGQ